MQIIQARENEMFFKQCLGQFDLKETYLFESVGFEQIHIRTFFSFFTYHDIKKWISLVFIVNFIAGLILFKISRSSFGFIKLSLKKMKQSSKNLFQFCSKYFETGRVNKFLIIAYSSISW